MKKVSIKYIAQKARVSNATVSLVLNGKDKKGRVSTEVAERIRKIAKDLNYKPNALARSLQSGKTNIIGLIVADISNPFFSSLAYYIQDQIQTAGYSVMITSTNENDQHMGMLIDTLKNHQVDGYIIVPTEHGEKYIQQLIDLSFPLVLIDRFYPALQTYSVTVDNYQACFQATNLLIKQGCKRIGLLIYNNNQSHTTERKYGYMDALQQAGLFNDDYIRKVEFSTLKDDISKSISLLLDQKVDGLLFATNSISLMGLHALFERGIKIPEQMKVVCFDKSDAFEFMPDHIPYIQQPIEIMGRKAADLLLEQMQKKEAIPQVCKYPATFIYRDSK